MKVTATGYTNTRRAGDILINTLKPPDSKLIVLMKTIKLIAVFRYVPVYALIVLPKNVSFLNFLSLNMMYSLMLSLQKRANNSMNSTPNITITPIKMKVDMFARKSVDSIDDASSLALILV